MQSLIPYLMFDGNCEEAILFYKDCFNGEVPYMGRFGDAPMEVLPEEKNKIMHTEFRFWGGAFMASDHIKSSGLTADPNTSTIHLSLGFENNKQMDQTFERLKEGGRVTMELQETFWGDRFGMIQDRFGINWMLNGKTKKK